MNIVDPGQGQPVVVSEVNGHAIFHSTTPVRLSFPPTQTEEGVVEIRIKVIAGNSLAKKDIFGAR